VIGSRVESNGNAGRFVAPLAMQLRAAVLFAQWLAENTAQMVDSLASVGRMPDLSFQNIAAKA
jgi:hypothetical protein